MKSQSTTLRFRRSSKYQKLLSRAVSMEEPLFPSEAMEWIQTAYGRAVDNIGGYTLRMMILFLCLRNGYPAEITEIDAAVLDFMNS